jgi:16S rRNA (guanine(966)-N(2))-methyltransferase RsmD
MRIIGGKYKRRIIHPPKHLPVRPTTDLAKESLFNILSNKIDLDDKAILDLFSGTGAISFEFASRGCKEITAVEQNHLCIRFIKKVFDELGFEHARAIRADVFRFVKTTVRKYDVIFADPPYDLDKLDTIPQMIFENELLETGGMLILEHPGEYDFSTTDHFLEHRKYGHVNFSFFLQHDKPHLV